MNAASACLPAEYRPMNGKPIVAPTEFIARMWPLRWARMVGSTARTIRWTPNRNTSSWACASSSVVSSMAPITPNPALLNSTSMRPARASTASTHACTDAADDSSSGSISKGTSADAWPLRQVPNTR
jgi:hypothetical protein